MCANRGAIIAATPNTYQFKMRAEIAIFVVMFKKAESSEMVSIGEVFEDFILQESVIRGHHVFKGRYALHYWRNSSG